jgi:hypothetical protein
LQDQASGERHQRKIVFLIHRFSLHRKGHLMNDQQKLLQRMLDSSKCYMQEAKQRTCPDLAATRVLHSFVTVLSQQLLDSDQQQQVEELLVMHEMCIRSGNAEHTAIANTLRIGQQEAQSRLNSVNGRLAVISRNREHPHMKRTRALVAIAPLLEALSLAFLSDEQQDTLRQIVEVLIHL